MVDAAKTHNTKKNHHGTGPRKNLYVVTGTKKPPTETNNQDNRYLLRSKKSWSISPWPKLQAKAGAPFQGANLEALFKELLMLTQMWAPVSSCYGKGMERKLGRGGIFLLVGLMRGCYVYRVWWYSISTWGTFNFLGFSRLGKWRF